MIIRLYDSVEAAIIIENSAGPKYVQQIGGTACFSGEINGYFIPIRNDKYCEGNELIGLSCSLSDYFIGPKHRGTGAIHGIDEEDVGYINAILDKNRLPMIRVDPGKSKLSMESWIWVTILDDECVGDLSIYCGLEKYPSSGILTWPNSD